MYLGLWLRLSHDLMKELATWLGFYNISNSWLHVDESLLLPSPTAIDHKVCWYRQMKSKIKSGPGFDPTLSNQPTNYRTSNEGYLSNKVPVCLTKWFPRLLHLSIKVFKVFNKEKTVQLEDNRQRLNNVQTRQTLEVAQRMVRMKAKVSLWAKNPLAVKVYQKDHELTVNATLQMQSTEFCYGEIIWNFARAESNLANSLPMFW